MKAKELLAATEGTRKYRVVLYAITWSGVLALLQRLTPEFATIVTVGVTVFGVANAFEHHARRNSHVNGTPAPLPPPGPPAPVG